MEEEQDLPEQPVSISFNNLKLIVGKLVLIDLNIIQLYYRFQIRN